MLTESKNYQNQLSGKTFYCLNNQTYTIAATHTKMVVMSEIPDILSLLSSDQLQTISEKKKASQRRRDYGI